MRFAESGQARVGAGSAEPSRLLSGPRLVALYAVTLLLAALLLFSVQPMFTKRVLPLLGGTPAVWSVAMVVFQALLLAGYAYAHAVIRWLPHRTGFLLHGLVLLVGFLGLPIAIAAGFETPPEDAPAVWLMGLFLASIGAPFFALSASAPLLQAWFARSGERRASDPYFLYRASNAGSLVALLAYPFLIEPLLGLVAQGAIWSVGYGALICAIAACGSSVRSTTRAEVTASARTATAPTWTRRAAWIALSAVPSGLLVAATAFISTDVAAIPLIWVVPLALYLASFILAFRTSLRLPMRLLGGIQVAGTSFLCLEIVLGSSWNFVADLVAALALVFVGALIAHRTVYRLRPPAARLTEFYLCTSLGGVIGGVFAALLAPNLFSGIDEFPILLAAALLCRPGIFPREHGRLAAEGRRVLLVLAPVGLIAMALWPFLGGRAWIAIVIGLLLFVFAVNWRAPQRVALLGAVVALATIAMPMLTADSVESHRSFFGVHHVQLSRDGHHRLLWHGTTLHGAMRVANDDGTPFTGRPEPATYYTVAGPLAQALEIGRRAHGPLPTVSVVGLGTGSLACHARPGEAWTYYEIDPTVIRIARDPKLFRFLSDCAPETAIVPGDARLTLGKRPHAARVLVMDAFSSDAIPMHLLTREALDVALSHLDENGLLVLHISNRNFALDHVLARLAAERGLTALQRLHMPEQPSDLQSASQAVMLTRDPSIERKALALGWTVVTPDMSRRPWTDDYANAFEAMADRWRSPALR